ncbi:hypothetical protein [Acinetobacter sp. WCHA29]|uniref:hypothetical protein n=1 Tax=Acinetobacter sp. WCHA29 TaxID=2004649 RepID=UPI000B3CAED5|nr:hypothetical protein [Acinetobacter sp. WCHA29]
MTNKILVSALCTGALLLTACGGGGSSNESYTTTSTVDYNKSKTIDSISLPIVSLTSIKYNPLYFISNLADDTFYYADKLNNNLSPAVSCESGTFKKDTDGSVILNNCKNIKINDNSYNFTISGKIYSNYTVNEDKSVINNDLSLTNFIIKYNDSEIENYNGKVVKTYTFNDATENLKVDYKINNLIFTWSDNTNKESYNLTDYLLTETHNVGTYTTTKAQAKGRLQATIDNQKFSVIFDSNREYDLYSSSPNIAVINIQDTDNSKNAITIKNTSNGKVLISAFANGTSVSGYPKTVNWDYFE